MRRTKIVCNAPGPDAVQAKGTEPKIHDGVCGFGGVTVVPMFGIQLVADIRLEGIWCVHADATIADQLVIRFQTYRQLKLDARLLLLMVEKPADKFLDSLRCSFRPFVI